MTPARLLPKRLAYKGSPTREHSVRSRLGVTERAFEVSRMSDAFK